MTYTSHGHHIPNSPENLSDIPPRARCGGPGLCGLCSSETNSWREASEREEFFTELDKAKQHAGIMIPRTYRSKPVDIRAIQFTGGPAAGMDLEKWVNSNGGNATWQNAAEPWVSPEDPSVGHEGWPERLRIETLEGWMDAPIGSWIIQGIEGEFYPCKDSVFKTKYEELT